MSQNAIDKLGIYLKLHKQITQDRSTATKLIDTVAKSYLQKQIDKNDLESFTKKISKVSGYKQNSWNNLIKERIGLLKRNTSLVNTVPTLDDFLAAHQIEINNANSASFKSSVYFTKDNKPKVIKLDNTSAVALVSKAINKQENIRLLASKIDEQNILEQIYDFSSCDPARDFIVLNFKLTYLSKFKKHLPDFSENRYILLKTSPTKARFILDINQNLNSFNYSNLVKSFGKYLGIKLLPTSTVITNPVIISNIYKDNIIEGNIAGKPFTVTEEMIMSYNSLDLTHRPKLKKTLERLGLGTLFGFEDDPNTGNTRMTFNKIRDNLKLCPKSMNELYKRLRNIKTAWLMTIGQNSNPKFTKLPIHVVYDALDANELWIQPLTTDNDIDPKTLPPYYMDYDKKIYQFEPAVISKMIHMLLPDLYRSSDFKSIRKHIGEWLAVPTMPDLLKPENGHNLIALKNGIFNLKTKSFKGYNYSMVILRKLNIEYKPSAITSEPHFGQGGWWSLTKFFKEATNNHQDRIKLLFQGILAAMQGAYFLKQMLLIVSVAPNTGKSTYLDIVRNICKEGVASVSIDSLTPEMCAGIVGKFVVLGDELRSNRPIQIAGVFKQLIANNPVAIHVLKEIYCSMPLNVFVMQACNGFPRFVNSDSTGSNESIFDRIRAVVFHHTYKKNAKNKKVIDEYVKSTKLAEWLVNYILMNDDIRLDDGLEETKESDEILADQQVDEDPVLSFKEDVLDGQLDISNYIYVPEKTLYNMFVNYYNHNNFNKRDRPSLHAFVKQMKLKAPEWRIKRGAMKEKYYVNPLNEMTYTDKPYFLDPSTITKDDQGNSLSSDLIAKMQKALPVQEKIFKSYHELFPQYFAKPGQNKEDAQSFYDDIVQQYEGDAGNIASHTLNEKQQMANASIYKWGTTWFINGKAVKRIDDQIKAYNHYKQAYFALNNYYASGHNISMMPDPNTKFDLRHILQKLPVLLEDYLNSHSTFGKDLNSYMDVYKPYLSQNN